VSLQVNTKVVDVQARRNPVRDCASLRFGHVTALRDCDKVGIAISVRPLSCIRD